MHTLVYVHNCGKFSTLGICTLGTADRDSILKTDGGIAIEVAAEEEGTAESDSAGATMESWLSFRTKKTTVGCLYESIPVRDIHNERRRLYIVSDRFKCSH